MRPDKIKALRALAEAWLASPAAAQGAIEQAERAVWTHHEPWPLKDITK